MSTCPSCDFPQVGNETFCSNCGTRVFGAVAQPPTVAGRRFATFVARLRARLHGNRPVPPTREEKES